MPKFNERVTMGFHQREFQNVKSEYERRLRMTLSSLEKRGVWFFGVKSVRPTEMYNVLANKTQNRTFEINKESLFPVKIQLGYGRTRETAQLFNPAYVLLPYCDEYGDIFIRGSHYSLQIVLADRGVTVTKDDQIFVRVLGNKFKVSTETYEFVQIQHMLTSPINAPMPINLPANRFYQASETRKPDVRAPIPLLAWYVFAEYGFTKTMSLFGECDFVIGDRETLIEQCPAKEGWTIYTTKGNGVNRSINKGPYEDLGFGIALKPKSEKRKGEIPNIAQQYAAALLFMFDVASEHANIDLIDEDNFWKIIIGRSSIKVGENIDHIEKQMVDHFDSMSEPLDEDSVRKFGEQHIKAKNLPELFNYIITNRAEIVKTSDKANMLGKQLCSLEFTIDCLITAANRFKHEVKNSTELNFKRVEKLINKFFKLREIENAAKDSNMILEATPTDNPLTDYGLGVMAQAKVSGQLGDKRGSKFNPNDPANAAHASVAFSMSWQRVTKPAPDGRGYTLPCIYLGPNNVITMHPDLRDYYEATHHRLTKREA